MGVDRRMRHLVKSRVLLPSLPCLCFWATDGPEAEVERCRGVGEGLASLRRGTVGCWVLGVAGAVIGDAVFQYGLGNPSGFFMMSSVLCEAWQNWKGTS